MDLLLKRGQKNFKCPSCETDLEIKYKQFKSGAKGGKYESFIADQFSWAMYNTAGMLTKCPGSGGWTNLFPFDVYPAKIDTFKFPFGIECKHRKGWSLVDIIRQKRSKTPKKGKADTYILDWWDKVKEDCEQYKEKWGEKIPILIMRRDGEKGDIAILDATFPGIVNDKDCYISNKDLSVVPLTVFLDYLRSKTWD